MRLNKFIANSSLCARRKADLLISEGRVKVNKKIISQLGTKIDPALDVVEVDDKIITPPLEKIYIALHKPAGYVSTCTDPQGRKTILDLIPKKFNVFPVGRLDLNTEGLILLTNDGELTFRLTHPKFQKEKEYYVKIKEKLKPEDLIKITNGLQLPSFKTSPAKITHLINDKDYNSLHLTIREGHKRQIREIFRFLDYTVLYLKRIRISNLQLGTLPKGEWKYLTPQEINNLKYEY